MNIKVNRLFNGIASVRDYIVQECKDKEEKLVILCNDQKMTVNFDKAFQISSRKFKSKFNDMEYQLVDFKFIPDQEEEPVNEL